jgi:hypothetical protein
MTGHAQITGDEAAGASGGLFGRLGQVLLAFEVGHPAFSFFDFVVLSAHKSLYITVILRLIKEV